MFLLYEVTTSVFTVDRTSIERIVNAEHLQHARGELVDQAGADADEEGAPGLDHRTGRGDAHEASEDRVAEGTDVILLATDALIEEHREAASRSGDGSSDGDLRGEFRAGSHDAEGGATVEAVPADPQDERAEDHESDIMPSDFVHLAISAKASLN
jgi:hypothetical protein